MRLIKDKEGIWRNDKEVNVSFPEKGLDGLFELEKKSFWLNHRNKVIKKVIDKFPFFNDFLDIGGGNGFQLSSLQKAYNDKGKFILCEPGYSGCINAKNRGIQELFNIKVNDFPFHDYNIDGIGLFDVVEHIEDDIQFIKEISALVGENKLIYITVPAHNYLWSTLDSSGGHYRRYNNEMVTKLSIKSGVELVYSSYFFSFLTPLIFLIRALPYKFGVRLDIEKRNSLQNEVHNPNKLITKIFSFFEKFELARIKKKTIKYGASLIVVFKT